MSISEEDIKAFEVTVVVNFLFLEQELGLKLAKVSMVEDDPRDSYVAARYRQGDCRIDVAWNPYSKSIGVLIRLRNPDLERREKYVYLEPFIEFVTDGLVTPVIPQIYPGMSVGEIERTMVLRTQLFEKGIVMPLEAVALRLKEHCHTIFDATTATVRRYHQWYQTKGTVS